MENEEKANLEIVLSDALKFCITPLQKGYAISLFEKKGGQEFEVVLNDLVSNISIMLTSDKNPNMAAELSTRTIFIDVKEIQAEPKKIVAVLHELGHIAEIHSLPAPMRPLYTRLLNSASRDWSERYGRFNSYTIQAERNAWTEAFKMYRLIRAKGVDISELFGSALEMAKYCMSYHADYENDKSSVALDGFLLRLCEPLFISRSLRAEFEKEQER